MATARLMKRHVSKGKSITQTLTDSFNYALNPAKTRNGELVATYMCDQKTVTSDKYCQGGNGKNRKV